MIDSKDLRKIIRFCQKNGIIKFKSGDFEIELKEKHFTKTTPGIDLNSKEAFPSWESLSPEQRLLWSATPDIGGST